MLKNILKQLHRFGQKPEHSRVPDDGALPRPNDTTVAMGHSPDPVMHHPAAASADADAETGAGRSDDSSGRTEPLDPAPIRQR